MKRLDTPVSMQEVLVCEIMLSFLDSSGDLFWPGMICEALEVSVTCIQGLV